MYTLTTKTQYKILLFLMNYCVPFPPREIMDKHLLVFCMVHFCCLLLMTVLFFGSIIMKIIIGMIPIIVVIALSWGVDEKGNNILDKISYFFTGGVRSHPHASLSSNDVSYVAPLLLGLMVPVIGMSLMLGTFILRKIYDCYPEIKIPEE